jgi:delta(3,5)-delta(2,4)-dienoyl-CoA isomerase
MAVLIASKSPIAVTTSKLSLNYSRDHSVQEGLDHVLLLNSVMLQTGDVAKAAMGSMQK